MESRDNPTWGQGYLCGLAERMDGVLRLHKKLCRGMSEETIHDLRVSIRRCRSIAAGMREVDPDPTWKFMSKAGKELFKPLGQIRDIHVMRKWLRKLFSDNKPALRPLLEVLKQEERLERKSVRTAAKQFDRSLWRKWSKSLPERLKNPSVTQPVFESVALKRWAEALQCHRKALRTGKLDDYHQLRIHIKRFRYTVENFLPIHYERWGKNLEQLQDILGEVHDFQVLQGYLERPEACLLDAQKDRMQKRVETEIQSRLKIYRDATCNSHSLWTLWRNELPKGQSLRESCLAKLKTWAAGLDPDPVQTGQVVNLALKLLEIFQQTLPVGSLRPLTQKQILMAAAWLHRVRRDKSPDGSPKQSARLIRKMSSPYGWSRKRIGQVASVVRYHQGEKVFRLCSAETPSVTAEQQSILFLAGLLRLARSFQSYLVPGEKALPMEIEDSPDRIILKVILPREEIIRSEEVIQARLHLEAVLGKPFDIVLTGKWNKE